MPVDLSNVLFILTANDSSKISYALQDRLHVINVNGYDSIEKKQIAHKYLIPKALEKSGNLLENLNYDLVLSFCSKDISWTSLHERKKSCFFLQD